jgi:Tol biopolymer transport system component
MFEKSILKSQYAWIFFEWEVNNKLLIQNIATIADCKYFKPFSISWQKQTNIIYKW